MNKNLNDDYKINPEEKHFNLLDDNYSSFKNENFKQQSDSILKFCSFEFWQVL